MKEADRLRMELIERTANEHNSIFGRDCDCDYCFIKSKLDEAMTEIERLNGHADLLQTLCKHIKEM